MTVTGPIEAIGTASTYDLPSSGYPFSSTLAVHLRVSSTVTSLAVIPWPPRSMQGCAPRMGQLTNPSALFAATIASVISLATAGESFPGVGVPAPAAAKRPAAKTAVVIMPASLVDRQRRGKLLPLDLDLARQSLFDELSEPCGIDRFVDSAVGRPFQKFARAGGERAAAHEHQPRGDRREGSRQLGVKVHAGHFGHHEIAEDEVEGLAGRDAAERLAGAR